MKATTGEEFDPSYLRLIRDRLEGNVPGAAELAALPFGLSGAFDEELSRWPIMERRPLLLWFGVFALSSKAIRLEWAESVLRIFDSQLSLDTESWRSAFSQKFNSAEPGEYALYHERFGSFVLQSIGQADVERLNAAIIHCCHEAMEGSVDSFGTRYALRHGADHYLKVAEWRQDANVLDRWHLNDEVWKAQFLLEGNWSLAIELCRAGLRTAAQLKDRKRLTQFAVALRQLFVREGNCAEEALNLFRGGLVKEALKRVWSWEDDRLLMWVCLCLTDTWISDSNGIERREDFEALFSGCKAKARCAENHANASLPLNVLFPLLHWMSGIGIQFDWFLDKVRYDFTEIQPHFPNHGDVHFANALFMHALGRVNQDEDWMTQRDPLHLLEVCRSFSWFLLTGGETVWSELMESLTAPIRAMVLTIWLQRHAREIHESSQLSRWIDWVDEIRKEGEAPGVRLRSWGSNLERRLHALKRGQASIPKGEDVEPTMNAVVLLMQALRDPNAAGILGAIKEQEMRVMGLMLQRWSWEVIKILGVNSRLFSELHLVMNQSTMNAEDDLQSMWLTRTSCALPEWTEKATLEEKNEPIEMSGVSGPEEFRTMLEQGVEMAALLPTTESVSEEVLGLLREHRAARLRTGNKEADGFSELVAIRFVELGLLQEASVWHSGIVLPQRAMESAYRLVSCSKALEPGWKSWKSALIEKAHVRFIEVTRPEWRESHIQRVVEMIFRGMEKEVFENSDICGLLLGSLRLPIMGYTEYRADNAALAIHSKQGQGPKVENDSRREALVSKAKLLHAGSLSVDSWSQHLESIQHERNNPEFLFTLIESCLNAGRMDLCPPVGAHCRLDSLMKSKQIFGPIHQNKSVPVDLSGFLELDARFRYIVWVLVKMSTSEMARPLFETLWSTRDEESELWQAEVKLWRSFLPSLPHEIQAEVYNGFIQVLRQLDQELGGLYQGQGWWRLELQPAEMKGLAVFWKTGNHQIDEAWFLSSLVRRGEADSVVELFGQRSSVGRWCLTEMSLEAIRTDNWSMVDSWILRHGPNGKLDMTLPNRIHEVVRRTGGGLNVHVALNWIYWIKEPTGPSKKGSRRNPRLTSLRAIFEKDVLDDWEEVVQSFIGLEMTDEALNVLMPSVLLDAQDWSMIQALLAHQKISDDGLKELVWALAFGERWEQVTSPETAMRTPGLEELVDLRDWGYA